VEGSSISYELFMATKMYHRTKAKIKNIATKARTLSKKQLKFCPDFFSNSFELVRTERFQSNLAF
jgi:hypothetical protein